MNPILTLKPEAFEQATRYEKKVIENLDRRQWKHPREGVYFHRYLGERAFRAWLFNQGLHNFWHLDDMGYSSGCHFELRTSNGFELPVGLVHLHSQRDHEIRIYQKLRMRTHAKIWVITRVVELTPSPQIEILGYITKNAIINRTDDLDQFGKKFARVPILDLRPIDDIVERCLPSSVEWRDAQALYFEEKRKADRGRA